MQFYIDDELPQAPSIEHSALQTLITTGRMSARQIRNIACDRRFDRATRMMAVKEIIMMFECLPLDLDKEIADYISSDGCPDCYHDLSRELQAIANPNDLPY